MRWTIRAKLAVLVLAVLLPLVAGAAYKFWHDLRQARADAQARLLGTAQVFARHFDEVLSGQIENLETLASGGRLDRIHDEDLRTAAARLRVRHPFVHRVLTASADGRIIASSDRRPSKPRGFGDAGLLAAVLRSREPRVGAPRPGATAAGLVVPLVAPVAGRDGSAPGVIAAEVDLAALSTFVGRMGPEDGTSIAIVAADGIVVAGAGLGAPALGQALAASSVIASLTRERAGVAEWRWEDGVVRLAGAAPVATAPWTVIAAMSSDRAYGPAESRLRGTLGALGVVALGALTVAWLISRSMTRSVRSLMEGARGLAAGSGSVVVTASKDELAELAEQFNSAVTARRRAQGTIEARQRRIQALADVNLSLSQELDREVLLQQITQALVGLMGARTVVLWEVEPSGQTAVRRTWSTDGSVASVELPERFSLDEGGTGWVARHRRPLFIEDITDDARIVAKDWALRHGLVAFAALPVVAGDELLGVLTLNLARDTLPQDDDRTLLATFAAQAAVAIRNARLFGEGDARRRTAETLSDLGRTLAQELDLGVVAQRIADSVRALLSVQSSGLFRIEPDTGDAVALAVSGDTSGGFDGTMRFPNGTGMVGLATRFRRAVATPDLLTDFRIMLPPDARAGIEQASYRALLAIPLLVKDTVIGALAVGDREGRSFDDEEIRLAQAFADQAALALDNARLYEEASLRLRHLDSLREAVEQMLVPMSLDERLSVIARKTAELFDADRTTIALWSADHSKLIVRAGHGLNEREVGRVLSEGAGVISTAASRREGVLVNDYESWPGRDPYIVTTYQGRPAQAVIGYPLLIHDQVIGAISVGLHTPGKRFVQADLNRLASLAVPAALAIEHGRLYEELAARLLELQDTQTQLVQAGKLSAVGQLVSGVAHELNNPLSVVIGYGQLLLGRDLPSAVRRPIELIVAQGDRMAKIVQSLLLLSRQRKPERGAVNVRETMEQTIALRSTQLTLSGIRVETAFGDDVPAAAGDANQLQQVFLNLLLNAEQAILASGIGDQRIGDRIHIGTAARVEQGRTWVVIQLADNGPGIPPEVLPRIFEPFFTTKKVGEGTGLGLSVSYGIIQQHGGRLTARSQPGDTVFTLELPAMGRERTGPVDLLPAPARAVGNGRLALVVDDEESVVELVATLLRESGWRVDVASGGRAALEHLRQGRYELVVSDIRMPDGSGETLYRTATAECQDLAVRFVFMTGDTANPEAWQFLREPNAHVLEKPFTAQALLKMVEQATG
jgi:signal transduction histidine kinase